MDLGGIDGVAHIVALAVGDVRDQALGLAQLSADQLDDVDVLHLIVAADVVNLALTAFAHDQVDGLAVVLDIEPVADVEALAVDGEGLVMQGVDDHEGDQLLREVIGAIVVGAAADRHGQAVGPVIGQDQQVRRGLGTAVGAAGVDGCLLGEEEVGAVQGQVAVDLVSGDLVVALHTVFAAGIHHDRGPDDIGLEEDLRVLNGPVHVGLRGKIDDNIRLFLFKEFIDGSAVADVHPDEAEIGLIHDGRQRGQIARVGQLVDADDPVLRMSVELIIHKIASDKSGAAGHDNGHNTLLSLSVCRITVQGFRFRNPLPAAVCSSLRLLCSLYTAGATYSGQRLLFRNQIIIA